MIKTAIATLSIVAILFICNTPAFADTGAGVSIELETTVTGGSSGGNSWNWIGGGGSYSYTIPSHTAVVNGDDTSVVNGDDVIDNGSDTTLPDETIKPDEPTDFIPSESQDVPVVYPKKINWDLVLLFVVMGLAVVSVLGYRKWRKRKERLAIKE